MSLRMNLRSGVAPLAQFTGIGKGIAPAAVKPKRVQPFVAIGGTQKPKAKTVRAEDNGDDDPPMDNGDGDGDDDGDDDQALEDDDYGSDAPDDADSPEEAEAKRARRVARRARRMKAEDDDSEGGKKPAEDPADPPPPDDTADDGDPDTEMAGKGPLAMARRRERARCAAIFAHPAAASNVNLAAHLAFNTSMTRNQAIGALRTAPAAPGGELARAMSGYAGQRPGAPPAPEKPKALQIAASWDDAFAEAAASRNGRKK